MGNNPFIAYGVLRYNEGFSSGFIYGFSTGILACTTIILLYKY
jgi:hypothetical protein